MIDVYQQFSEGDSAVGVYEKPDKSKLWAAGDKNKSSGGLLSGLYAGTGGSRILNTVPKFDK